jgi:hypothetical protein
MAGHVVQVITDDRALLATFGAIHRSLRPAGRLAFDSRNPATRAWTRWTPAQSRRTLAAGVEVWLQDVRADADLVSYDVHYRFRTGEDLVSRNRLRFRSYGWLSHALVDTGFQVDPIDHDAPDLIFLASAAPAAQPVVLHIYPTPTLGVWRRAQSDQAEDLPDDHESQGAHYHGLILPARRCARSGLQR